MGLPNSREALPNGSGSIIPSSTILAIEDCLIALNRLLSGQAQGFFPTNIALPGTLTVGGQPLSFSDFVFAADATTDQLALTATSPLQTGDGPVRPTTTGTLPGGLLAGTDYFWIAADAIHGKLATSRANALAGIAVDITSAGTGTQTLQHQAGTTRISDLEVTRNLLVDGGMTVTGASSQAAITASGLITANAGVQATHYNLPSTTIPIPAEAFQKTIGSPTLDGGSGTGLWTFQSGANNTIVYGLILPVGTRITALKFHVNRASASSGSITCALNSKIVGGGNSDFGTPSGLYADALSSGGTYTTRDLIAIAGAPFTTIAGSAYWLEIGTNLNFTGAVPQFDGVEMTIDHV